MAGSIAERVDGATRGRNTSVHFGPDGEARATYRKIHMFDVEVGGRVYRESEHEEPGDEVVLSSTADGVELGLTICYDLRFPELYRELAVRGARVLAVPAAFTLATTREHWEVLLRARAIEDQAFVVAANQVGQHAPGYRSGGRSMIVDPWGLVLAQAPDVETFAIADLDLERQAEIRRTLPSLANRRLGTEAARPDGAQRRRRTSAGSSSTPRCACSRARASTPAGCRTSPTRRRSPTGSSTTTSGPRTRCSTRCSWSAGTSCSRRSARPTRTDIPAREKLYAIASFIIDSYRHDPELMKVIIVEVTRAANSFGRTHLPKIGEAYGLIAEIVRKAQADGSFRDSVTPEFAAMAFYGAIEQVLTGWIFGLLEQEDDDYERAKDFVVGTICDGLEAHASEPSA